MDCIFNAINTRTRNENFRIYVTDCLYSLCAAWGNKPGKRYFDILHPTPEDNRSGEELVAERLARFGIKVVD